MNDTGGTMDSAPLEGRYSNYFQIGHNAFEFIFEFGQFYSKGTEPTQHSKIVMSPHYAKNLLQVLQESVLQYEATYGPIIGIEMATLLSGGEEAVPVSSALSPERAPAAAPRSIPVSRMRPSRAQQFDDAVKAMLDTLKTYLLAGGGGLPAPAASLASVRERSLGLDNRRGQDARAGFGVVELKGGRLDALVRFELWAGQLADVELATQDLVRRLLADRDKLWPAGFLRLGLEATSTADNVASLNAWRQAADVRVLYEFHFEDSDDSQGLIARIPIHIDSTYDESTTVTDEMTRWDDQNAPRLVVRGPVNISGLSALVFVAGPAPGGTVTLTRTFDGAPGAPQKFPTLAAFLAAVGQTSPNRNAQLKFAAWNNFTAIFSPGGNTVTLGGKTYSPLEVGFVPVIPLPDSLDRFEIAYQKSAFEVAAVVYLRAT